MNSTRTFNHTLRCFVCRFHCFPSPSQQTKLFRTSQRSFASKSTRKERFLVTGSLGQIGSELVPALRVKYGRNNVIATDIRQPSNDFKNDGPYQYLNVEDYNAIESLVVNEEITHVIHLSALLSATAERDPERAFRLLMRVTEHMCNICTRHKLSLFIPSSIAAFGPTSPLVKTPDHTVQRPRTIYGVGKVYTELLGEYFHYSRGLDFRSLRFPGILSWKTPPGGGTHAATHTITHSYFHSRWC
jgi:threonine 3-dehydrogenase